MRRALIRSAALAALAVPIVSGGPGLAEIGAVGAVNPLTTGQPPAAPEPLQLEIAEPVVQDEIIVSGLDGAAQIMFLDQTTLTVGPNAEVVLDSFVYDPAEDAGDMALTLTRGALRFIGGRISKRSDATVTVGEAVIALRGAVAHVEAGESQGSVTFLAGEYARVALGDESLTISRPGGRAVFDFSAGTDRLRYAGVIDAAGAAGLFDATVAPGGGVGGGAGLRAAIPEAPALASVLGAAAADPISTLGEQLDLDGVDVAELLGLADSIDAGLIDFANEAFLDANIDNVGFVDIGGEGELRGQLVWNDQSDLDLFLDLPTGERVGFSNPTQIFGEGAQAAVAALDADNLGGVINVDPDLRVENITVNPTIDGAVLPAGRYVFFVDAFSISSETGTPFLLTVSDNGQGVVRSLEGALLNTGDVSDGIVAVRPDGGIVVEPVTPSGPLAVE